LKIPTIMERGRFLEFEIVTRHPEWNYVVLRVKDADVAIRFYHEFAGMGAVMDIREQDGKRWVRMHQPEHPEGPVLVLEETPDAGDLRAVVGFRTASRAEVDRLATKAARADCLTTQAYDGGSFRGYVCTIVDPDGNHLEFFCPIADKPTQSA